MRRLRAVLVGAVAVLCLIPAGAQQALAAPLPAPVESATPSADPTPGTSAGATAPAPRVPNEVSTAAADGYFYAYEDRFFEGEYCRWDGDHSNYVYADWLMPSDGQCWDYFIDPEMNDAVSSVWNNGYGGSYDAVRMYKHANYGSPWMCLSQGDYWADLDLGYERFSDGTFANDQISSHRWVDGC